MLTGKVSSKSQFNWTIVQFNLGLSGFTKAYKAVLAWTIKQEKGGRSALVLMAFFFPDVKLLCSLMQYDTPFISSLMNQGLAKGSAGEIWQQLWEKAEMQETSSVVQLFNRNSITSIICYS